jgi:ATP-dependent DNA helicase RecQ
MADAMGVSEEAALAALHEVFNLQSFRAGQLEAISATLAGQDSLVILPTGGGKSVTFQLPCHLKSFGFTVVVCPLIALAKDQVRCARGVKHTA